MRRATLAPLLALLAAACDHEPPGLCESTRDCLAGQVCAEGVCAAEAAAPANRAPAAAPDAYGVAADGTLAVPAAGGVLVNDTDSDGDALVAERVVAPAHGVAYLSPDGAFVYVPDPGFAGSDGFTYRASDGFLRSDVTGVTLTVGP